MARDELDTPDSHDSFDIPGWHEEVALWLDFCEEYWRHFRREREVMRLGPLTDYRGGDKVPYFEIENRYGRCLPAVARAAAGLRRSLALAIERLLPETGVALPDGEDEVERAMAASTGWEVAVEIAFADIGRMKELLAAARPAWGVTAATDFLSLVGLLREELERQVRAFETAARPGTTTLSTRPIATTDFTRLPADRINKAVIEALAPGAITELSRDCLGPSGPAVDLRLGYLFRSRRPRGKDFLAGVLGLREEPDASLLALLRRRSDLAVKIHLALWERAYLEAAVAGVGRSEAAPISCEYVTTTVARLCDDIGLRRKKGAHRREGREAAVALLRLLASLELVCVYQPPRNVPPEVIRGPVWRRGAVMAGAGRYEDLFALHQNEPAAAEPQAFSYAPGHYFENSTWRAHNRFVALVPAGLLGAGRQNLSRWDVMVGAYLTVLARMNRYRRLKLGLYTLAEKTGLLAVYKDQNLVRMQELAEGALDRLTEAGVIRRWDWNPPRGGKADDDQAALTLFVDWPEHTEKHRRRLYRKGRKKSKAWIDARGSESP